RRGQLGGIARTIERKPEQAGAGDLGGNAADIGTDPRIASGAGGKAVLLTIGHSGIHSRADEHVCRSWAIVSRPPRDSEVSMSRQTAMIRMLAVSVVAVVLLGLAWSL